MTATTSTPATSAATGTGTVAPSGTPFAPAAVRGGAEQGEPCESREPRESLERVVDPEIPVLTIADLGVLRGVTRDETGHVDVVITPTYSGCPALDAIRADVVTALASDGFHDVTVHTQLAPAWSSDDITERGRRRLAEFGIAPPHPARRTDPVPLLLAAPSRAVRCPACASGDTREVSRFGSTACKAHYVCQACLEPFDYFKDL